MKKTIFILALFLVSVLSVSIEPSDPLSKMTNTPSVGGFPNKISMGYERVNSLINFINAASVLYRDDLKQNILYIHASMTAAYENDGEFGIVIESDSTNTQSAADMFGSYASFAPGINLINPSWSYYCHFIDKSDERKLEYIPSEGRGAGIDDARAARINEILKKNDGNHCSCSNVPSYELEYSIGSRWAGVCHSGPTAHAYIPVKHQQWIASKPAQCHYLMYVVIL